MTNTTPKPLIEKPANKDQGKPAAEPFDGFTLRDALNQLNKTFDYPQTPPSKNRCQ